MKQKKKQKPIAGKVAFQVCGILILMCICLSLAMQNAFYRELSLAESQYMTEVIARISLEVNSELNHYIDAAHSTAQSKSIQEYLLNVESNVLERGNDFSDLVENPEVPTVFEEEFSPEEEMVDQLLEEQTEAQAEEEIENFATPPEQEVELPLPSEEVEFATLSTQTLSAVPDFSQYSGYDTALAEMEDMAELLGDNVLFIALCSIYEDNFFNHEGLTGDATFTLNTRPFYPAYTTQKTYITDPYEEVLSGITIITIAEPIFDEVGRVIGLLLVQMSVADLGDIVTSATFGETGASMLMDRNNTVIAYSEPSVIGMNISQLSYTGEGTEQELSNPTGKIMNYSFGGALRTGGIVEISELSGWKMILAMDETEFKSNISLVTLRLNIGLTLAVLLCSGLCARSIYVNLAPMKELEAFMEELADGNLASTVDYEEPNEIGRLATHMNQTVGSLAGYIDMIDRAMKGLERGDLTRPENVDFRGDFKNIEESIEQFVWSLSDSLREIRMAMEQMNQGAEQVASGAQLLANGSAEQSNSVEQLNSLIGNINDTIVETAKNSSNVTTDAKNISDNLVMSNGKMQELVVSVQDIRAMSDEVKRIIKTIEDVAFQTNILSLNASVEAARAGTSGRGFAVVADEVRNLSFKTAEAAEETTKIINDIAEAIETGTELAQSTSTDLQSVVNEVDIFVENISNISLSAQDQAEAMAEIHRGIDEIAQVVVQNSAISEESAASSQELSAQSVQMLSLVARYKLVEEKKKRDSQRV